METISATNRNERWFYLDFLRVISIFAVILIHIAAPRTYMEIGCHMWNVLTVYGNLIDWAVPVFVMISGALYLSPEREVPMEKLFRKHILRMIIVFVFWSAVYAVFDTYIYNPTSVRQDIAGVFTRFFLGHSHLWFLFMIVGLYLLVPLLRKITADWNMVRYFLLLAIMFNFVFPMVLSCLDAVDFILTPPDSLREFADQIYSKVDFHFTLGYVVYFVAGYYLSKAYINKKMEWCLYILAILSGVVSIVYTMYGSAYARMDLVKLPHFPNLFQPAAIFVFARLHVGNNVSKLSGKIINFIAGHSFGMYLVHYLVLILFQWLVFDASAFNPVFSVPLIGLTVYILSLVLAVFLRKIPVVRKYFL